MFRAVTLDEALDIRDRGCFANPPGLEVKYFATTRLGAERYAALAAAAFGDGPFVIMSTAIDAVLIDPSFCVLVDGSIETVTVPTNILYLLQAPPELDFK